MIFEVASFPVTFWPRASPSRSTWTALAGREAKILLGRVEASLALLGRLRYFTLSSRIILDPETFPL